MIKKSLFILLILLLNSCAGTIRIAEDTKNDTGNSVSKLKK